MTVQKKNQLTVIGSYIGVAVATCTLVGVVWGTVLLPQVDKRIECVTKEREGKVDQKLDKIIEGIIELKERLARHEGKEEK